MKNKPRQAENTEVVHEAYPMKTVAQLTGLSPDVIRAWERRHAVISPVRGPRGARLYSGADIAHLRLLAHLVARGRAIGDIAGMKPEVLREIVQKASPAHGESTTSALGTEEEVLDRVLSALNAFDSAEVERLLGESLMALGARQFVSRIGVPLLESIGERWRVGELSVAARDLPGVAPTEPDLDLLFGRARLATSWTLFVGF